MRVCCQNVETMSDHSVLIHRCALYQSVCMCMHKISNTVV